MGTGHIHRGYYMAARRYEISLRVLKNMLSLVKYFFQQEKRNFVSPSDHVIFYLLYKHQTILLKKFFGLKGAVYYEAIAMVIFSHVKIHMWSYVIPRLGGPYWEKLCPRS